MDVWLGALQSGAALPCRACAAPNGGAGKYVPLRAEDAGRAGDVQRKGPCKKPGRDPSPGLAGSFFVVRFEQGQDLVARGFAGVVVQKALGGEGSVGRRGQVFALHAVVLEPGLDVQVPEQGAECGLDIGSALQHAQDARAVVTAEDVRDDGVLFRIGNIVEAHGERRADGHGKAMRDMAFHGQRRPDGMDDAVLRIAKAHAGQG